jgi:hypothetical protein
MNEKRSSFVVKTLQEHLPAIEEHAEQAIKSTNQKIIAVSQSKADL